MKTGRELKVESVVSGAELMVQRRSSNAVPLNKLWGHLVEQKYGGRQRAPKQCAEFTK